MKWAFIIVFHGPMSLDGAMVADDAVVVEVGLSATQRRFARIPLSTARTPVAPSFSTHQP